MDGHIHNHKIDYLFTHKKTFAFPLLSFLKLLSDDCLRGDLVIAVVRRDEGNRCLLFYLHFILIIQDMYTYVSVNVHFS